MLMLFQNREALEEHGSTDAEVSAGGTGAKVIGGRIFIENISCSGAGAMVQQ